MPECRGGCTVRIFETRNLSAEAQSGLEEHVVRRILQRALDEMIREQKESGCESDSCDCVPLADYMPDEKGRRKKTPDWTVFRVRNVMITFGSGTDVRLFQGAVESRSAIVPGLCEPTTYIDLSRTPLRRSPEQTETAPSRTRDPAQRRRRGGPGGKTPAAQRSSHA
jgi:hypothetical protein